MGAHPWKAEDLAIDDWDESADDYYQKMVDDAASGEDTVCDICFTVGDYSVCACSAWDDDCWIGAARPWIFSRGRAPPMRLSAKGERMHNEARIEYYNASAEVYDRRQRRKARRNWMRIKDAVDARRIGFYWMEATQRGLCAPGGAGRAADAAAFGAEF